MLCDHVIITLLYHNPLHYRRKKQTAIIVKYADRPPCYIATPTISNESVISSVHVCLFDFPNSLADRLSPNRVLSGADFMPLFLSSKIIVTQHLQVLNKPIETDTII